LPVDEAVGGNGRGGAEEERDFGATNEAWPGQNEALAAGAAAVSTGGSADGSTAPASSSSSRASARASASSAAICRAVERRTTIPKLEPKLLWMLRCCY